MRDYASLYTSLLSDLGIEAPVDSHIFSDMDYRSVAKQSLACSFYKKLCPKGTSSVADAAALTKFKVINDQLPLDAFRFEAQTEVESLFWDYYRYHVNMALQSGSKSYDTDYIRESMDVGPGSAQGADSSSMVTKLFNGKMTYTDESLIRYYRAALASTGFWSRAEEQRFKRYGFTKVRGGKLFFAPKNAEISRTCCTEASLNMIIQKSLGAFFEESLQSYFGISLSSQPAFNKELARIGSIDGSFGTIDLISASDSIGLHMLNETLDNNFIKAMIRMSRSELAVLPDGTEVKLRMVSTMGNGFTFPLETLLFASAVRACYQLMDFPSNCSRTQFGVFGDDIVVRREVYDFVTRMLTKLGFSVNMGKSFNSGPFRESCGGDYHKGCDVRGVYVTSLETPQQVYSCFNRLTRWSARTGIQITATLRLLWSWARDIRVPLEESDDAGFCVPFKCIIPKVTNTYWFQYRCYKRRVKRVKVEEPDSQDMPFNPDGIAVGYLSGHYRRRDILLNNPEDSAWKHDWSASFSLRDRQGARARYQIVKKSVPFWDYRPDSKQVYSPSDWHNSRREDLTVFSHDAWGSVVVATIPN